jgi:hypothetical protein
MNRAKHSVSSVLVQSFDRRPPGMYRTLLLSRWLLPTTTSRLVVARQQRRVPPHRLRFSSTGRSNEEEDATNGTSLNGADGPTPPVDFSRRRHRPLEETSSSVVDEGRTDHDAEQQPQQLTDADLIDLIESGGTIPIDDETEGVEQDGRWPTREEINAQYAHIDRSKFCKVVEIAMPDLGDDDDNDVYVENQLGEKDNSTAKLLRWHKQVGDIIERGARLCDLETSRFILTLEMDDDVIGIVEEIGVPAGTAGIEPGRFLVKIRHPGNDDDDDDDAAAKTTVPADNRGDATK